MKDVNVVLIGVGGQGTLLASKILGALAVGLHRDAKVSEVHGMAQRGGSVLTFFRMGERIHAPMIGPGGADYVLAFEKLEAARGLPYLRRGGLMIVNQQEIPPITVVTGAAKYPSDVLESVRERAEIVSINAFELARKAGEPRAVNLVLLGAFARFTGFDPSVWDRAIEETVPQRSLRVNMEAFRAGYISTANGSERNDRIDGMARMEP